MTRQEIVNLFIENVTKVAAEPIRMSNISELNEAMAMLLTESDSVFLPIYDRDREGNRIITR